MKRCKNCKYWIHDQESEKAFNENFGSCKNKKVAYIEDIESNNLKRTTPKRTVNTAPTINILDFIMS